MERGALYQLLLKRFALAPTSGQSTVMQHLAAFILSAKQQPVYLLKGYAGTGKTTLVTTLVKVLPEIGHQYVLLAPTGRAAKVLNQYTGKTASTIHRRLYQRAAMADGSIKVARKTNKQKRTVFIVDEASMISDSTQTGAFGTQNSLLDDLMEFVFEGESCRLLLIGDQAQLPPVGLENSPALDFAMLKAAYAITTAQFELTEVMRQSLESGILLNATLLRERMHQQVYDFPLFRLQAFTDIMVVEPDRFEELLQDAFGGRDHTEAAIICRSNKRANNFNREVRFRILGMEDELSAGDLLMIVKNNYFWMEEKEQGGFIANGDIAEVHRIHHVEEMYGLHFAEAEISLVDYPDNPALTVKLMLDTLMAESPALPEDAYQQFAAAVEEDYLHIPSRRQRYAEMKTNPYFNALQVKFAYALTCHKTQGGQWPKIFVDAGFLNVKDEADHNDFRWLYTAFTRATSKLYLVNFPEKTIED